MQVTNLINTIEVEANPHFSAKWDNSGIQVAGSKSEIQKLAVTLDPTQENIVHALHRDADFILTHHPLSISPKIPNKRDKYNNILEQLFQYGAWLYSAHTSLDVQTTGPVSWMAKELELNHIQAVDPISPLPILKLEVKIEGDAKQLLQYIETKHPHVEIAQTNPESFTVYCNHEYKNALLHTLTNQPVSTEIEAKEIYNQKKPCGYGIIGEFSQSVSSKEFHNMLDKILDIGQWTQVGNQPQTIHKVSYCPGSGMDIGPLAFSLGADVFISGDLKYHQAQELEDLGFTIDVGHFVLEEKMMEQWANNLKHNLEEDVQIIFIPGTNPLQEKIV